uniref:Cupin type-1 domain-containing protein n=1 Tax=Picea sitchensis TaxID=3332 RepID=A9NW52_PICSI|nr:unknown [Picea sitchensis]
MIMAFRKFSLLCLVVFLSLVVSVIQCNAIRHDRSYSEEGEEGENQFIFKRENWKIIDAEAGHIRVAPSFRENARSAPQLHNFEVNSFEMDPNSLMLPRYITASWYMYAYEGKGRIGWVHNQKSIEQDIEAGQVYYVPKGAPFYVINTDKNQSLHLINLMHNENPGSPDRHHESYYVGGGQDPPTVFSGFRRETLAAGFGIGIREVEKVLSKQVRGSIVSLNKEQTNDEFLPWPWSSKKHEGSEEEEKPFNLQKKELVFSNDHGEYIKADGESFRPLERLDMAMGLTTIKEESMLALHWSSRTTAVSMILKGRGRVEIVTPGRSESKREVESYKRVEAELTAGDLWVVPAGLPNAEINPYSDQPLVILTFHINNEDNEFYYLTGQHSVASLIKDEVMAISMNEKQQALEKVIDAQKDEMFLRGPKEDEGWSIV